MPRYAIVDKGLGLDKIELEALKLGARNTRKAPRSKQMFCELDPAAAVALGSMPGLAVKPVKLTAARQSPVIEDGIIYSALQASLSSRLWDLRAMFSPAVTGVGFTCAVLDTGIRKTHKALAGKVVYEENFTDSPGCTDVYDHGTGVAYLIAGGEHGPGLDCGVAPGAKIINLKCIGDDGIGTEEWLILALERARELFDEYYDDPTKLWYEDLFLNAVNVSAGIDDDGEEDNPVRVAVEELFGTTSLMLPLYCAAGNDGPAEQSIDLPAAARHAWAIGAVTFSPFEVWNGSSRGPDPVTGLVKPELVFYGVGVVVASAASDDAFVAKSGTSFSAPLAVGQLGLYEELAARYSFLSALMSLSREQAEELMSTVCIKPLGAPLYKDNVYGLGMPFGDLLARTLPGAPVLDTPVATSAEIVGALVPVMMLPMMGMMVRPVL